ncbi:MAG: cytochrome c oxidase subunit II [Gammaproteobacteria bacterium]|nr:cytochrome c oxidase subunit II [Gammaproteobacteria bacterium]
MLRKINKLIAAVSLGMAAGMQSAMAGFMDTLNLREGVTPISHAVYDLHMLILWVCVVIGVIVFGVMAYSMFAHRKSKGAVPAEFHESTKMEIVWTIVPFLILVGLAIPATKTLVFMADTTESDLEIKITGHQWKWEYEYLGEDVSFISSLSESSRKGIYADPNTVDNYLLDVDRELVLPVGKKIRFLITASDVLHAWWVPDLGQKQDAIPGFINEMWTVIEKPGVYRGQCAELCGRDHGFMPVVVRAVSEEEYASWLAEQKGASVEMAAAADKVWTADDLYAKGEEVYNTQCVGCHQLNGMGIPGTFPAINGGPVANGAVSDHLNLVMNGRAGTAMVAFKDQMSDVDIAAVITFQRNAWDNRAGDAIQPADVKAAR